MIKCTKQANLHLPDSISTLNGQEMWKAEILDKLRLVVNGEILILTHQAFLTQ